MYPGAKREGAKGPMQRDSDADRQLRQDGRTELPGSYPLSLTTAYTKTISAAKP
jgi:hypothetical protein